MKVENLSYEEMIAQFVTELRNLDPSVHESSCHWITGYDDDRWENDNDMDDFINWSFDNDDEMKSYLYDRFIEVAITRITSDNYNRRSANNSDLLPSYYTVRRQYAIKALTSAKYQVESDEGVLRVRFFEYVPAKPNTQNWLFLSYDGEHGRYGNIAGHWKLETFKNKLVCSAGVSDSSRTRKFCPKCRGVVNPTTDMFTITQGRNRPIKVCMLCTVYFYDFYELSTGIFHYVGDDTPETVAYNPANIRVSDRRNFVRYNLEEWIRGRVGVVPFIPNYRHEDYTAELNWSYWQTTDRGTQAIPSDRYGTGVQTDVTHESKEYARKGIPIGMELEVQYRDLQDNLSGGIRKLLAPLHKDFPYSNERLRTTNNQLAIASYDVSTGRHGLEFKFQPMSHQFVKQLPDDFFEALLREFRGYHAKRCGIHMNIPKNVLSTGQYWFFIAWHNMRLWEYTHAVEDEYHNLLGDIYQRVDVDYAKWLSLTTNSITESSYDFQCGCGRHDGESQVVTIACDTSQYLSRYRHSPDRACWINIKEPERMEIRAFASNTMKDRLLKNFQFLDAFLTYADAVTLSYEPSESYVNGIQKEFELAFEPDDLGVVLNHLNNQYLFVSWLDATGYSYQYPELAQFLTRTGHRDRAADAMDSDNQFAEQVEQVVAWS